MYRRDCYLSCSLPGRRVRVILHPYSADSQERVKNCNCSFQICSSLHLAVGSAVSLIKEPWPPHLERKVRRSSEGFGVVYQKSRSPETHIGRQPGNTGQNRWCNMVEGSSFQEGVQILTHNFAMSLSHLKCPHHPKACLLWVTRTGSCWIYNSVPSLHCFL